MSQQTAAKQLGELSKSHFVLGNKAGRETFYELAEPLMRICVDVKDNRTEHLKLFVEFMRQWFSERELRTKLETLRVVDAEERWFDRRHIEAAILECEADSKQPFLDSLGEEAKLCFDKNDYRGLQLDPANGRVSYGKANTLQRLGHLEEAITQYNHVLSLNPRHEYAQVDKAQALMDLGKLADASAICRKLMDRGPSEHIGLHVAPLLIQLGEWEAALRLTDDLLKQTGDHAGVFRVRGGILLVQEEYASAVESFRRAKELDASDMQSASLEAAALVGSEGFGVGLRALGRILEQAIDRNNLVTAIVAMIDIEIKVRGPMAMAKQIHLLVDLLKKHEQVDALANALTSLSKELVATQDIASVEWASALPILHTALANIPECQMALEMLSVMHRYKKTGDRSVLLELPLEQRTLISGDEVT